MQLTPEQQALGRPSPDSDPSRWGYPTLEHLLNWRLYWKYSHV